VQGANLPQYTVDSIADADETLFRLEMNIAGTARHRVADQRIDQGTWGGLGVAAIGSAQTLVIDFAVSISLRMPSIDSS